MNVLALAVIAGYIVSLLLRWSQNHSIVVGWPIFLMDWTRRTFFMALTFVLTYGSIFGIWYLFGIWIALGAYVLKLIVGRVSFHHYYKRAVDEHAEWEYQQMLRDRGIANVPLDQLDPIDQMMRTSGAASVNANMDEAAMKQEAYQRARYAIQKQIQRG